MPILACMFIFFIACEKDNTPTEDTSSDNPVKDDPIKEDPVKSDPNPTAALTYYVSTTTGNDTRSPSAAQNSATPWKSIQKAASTVPGGSIVIISGGTYFEKVSVTSSRSGTAVAPTIFKSKDGETAIIDGKNSGSQWEALFRVTGSYIKLDGLKAQNGYWYGFSIANGSSNITITNCATFNTRASGIHASSSSDITISYNKINKVCQAPSRDAAGNGSQECITLGGCNGFSVHHNEVWESFFDVGGEGIDAKGGCRNVEIYDNYVHDLKLPGIYVDAGSSTVPANIKVYRNRIDKTGAGLSVAAELGGTVQEIYYFNNVISNSASNGMVFQNIKNGRFVNIYVTNNTFYNNGTSSGFAGDVASFGTNTTDSNIQIRNNIFYNKLPNVKYTIWHNQASKHVISNNLYSDFKPSINGANSFATSGPTDVQGDPKFVSVENKNFHLQTDSQAINKATSVDSPVSPYSTLYTSDFDKKDRGSVWDIGAYEF